MPDPVYTTLPIPGTGIRERVVVNDDDTVSRPTQAVFADSSGLNAEATQLLFKSANHTDLAAILAKLIAAPATEATLAAILAKIIAAPATEATLATLATKLDTLHTDLQDVVTAIGLLPQA